jgi:hypothetical protein
MWSITTHRENTELYADIGDYNKGPTRTNIVVFILVFHVVMFLFI